MLLQWLHVVGALLSVLVIVKSEQELPNSSVYQKKNFSFEITDEYFLLNRGSYPVIPEGAIVDIPSMKHLDLYSNGIREIKKGAFRNLPNLRVITILFNELTKLESGVFNDLKLTRLNIQYNKNPLTISSDAFDNLTTLEVLRLNNNKITTWNPEWFKNTPALRQIDMDGNLLEELPAGAFQNLNPDVISFEIHLFLNQLRNISDEAFRGIKKIKFLDLGHNKLKEFNGDFLKGIDIEDLRIEKNDIRCIREEDFQKVFKARNLTHIENNPWDPVCLEQIKTWAKANDKIIISKINF